MTNPDLSNRLDVLIVDDHLETRNFLERALVKAGMQASSVANGTEAIARLHEREPDAVVLDVVMPGMDGFAVCEALREISAHIPVIFMTGLGETEHIVRGFEVGANDYISKPIAAEELVARLHAHTRVSSLARATREAINHTSTPLIAIDTDRLLWANDAAQQLTGLEAHAPDDTTRLIRALARDGAASTDSFLITIGERDFEARRVNESIGGVSVFSLGESLEMPQLTGRETEVLLWVARGKTNRDIAEILGVSPRTVNKHLEHVFEKLGVETRTAAVSVARNIGGSTFGQG